MKNNNEENSTEKKSTLFITEVAFDNIGPFGRIKNAKIVCDFHRMFWDFISSYGGGYKPKNRDDFEATMTDLNLNNNNLRKDADGYHYIKHANMVNKSADRITCFIDATDYINGTPDKKACLVGIIACLKCGGVVRINGKDYCSVDIDNIRI